MLAVEIDILTCQHVGYQYSTVVTIVDGYAVAYMTCGIVARYTETNGLNGYSRMA